MNKVELESTRSPPVGSVNQPTSDFTTAGNASLPPYAQVAWFSSASQPVRQEITRRIIELMVGYLGNSVNSLSANAINSIPAAKIRRKIGIMSTFT